MRFGVIVCPRCKCVKGVALSSKTTKCIRCGKTLFVKKMKIFYRTDSQQHLTQAVGLVTDEVEKNVIRLRKYTATKTN